MTSSPQSAEKEARIAALADKWKGEADKAAARSVSDPNAYLRMTIYERVERETRALLTPETTKEN